MKNPDIPIARREDDKLSRKALVQHLAQMLISGRGKDRRASRLTVGLTGSWGSGKSSVLVMLSEHLRSLSNVVVIEFNPWVFQGRDDLLDAFFDEVSAQLGRDGNDNAKAILKALDKYRHAIEPAIEHAMPGGRALSKLIPRIGPQSALAKRRQLEKKLATFEGAIVVLIDELDRVDKQEIRALARVIKAVVDLPNVSYLVSYDRSRVETALGDGIQDDGAAYLEKIVQVIVPLRPLITDEVRDLLFAGLTEAGFQETLGDPDLMDELVQRLLGILDTPRDVKRVVSSFAAMEPMVHGEVHPVDVLGYAAVCTKAPHARDTIANDIDAVVNDPADIVRIMKRGRHENPNLEEIFGTNFNEQMSNLLYFLFPILKKNADRDRERFGRIQERRNLLTMLFLGDPPFQISRKQIEAFWASPSLDQLATMRESGKFGDFSGQLYRLLPSLDAVNDLPCWTALAHETGRGDREMRANGRTLARDLRSILVEFGARGPAERSRSHLIVAGLIAENDFALVPDLVRYHMFAHGLVSGSSSRNGPTIYDKSETKALLRTELIRYREHVVSGDWLSSSRDVDVIFALEQGGVWDAELRAIAEQQLEQAGAVAEFSALFVPPGRSMEPGTVGRFVSEDLLKRLADSAEPPADEWLRKCLARLRTYLRGHDPEFERLD